MRFEFVIRSGREAGRTIMLATGQLVTFGRLDSCEVQLDDESVSRRHCTLHVQEDACVVSDLQSVNGTYVNDRRITTADLRQGDHLRIGTTVLEVAAASPRSIGTAPLSGSLRLMLDEAGPTFVRKSVDPSRPQFLSDAFRRKDEHALESAQRYLATLHHVSDLLSRASGVEGLFDSLISALLEVTNAERAAILMQSTNGGAEAHVDVVAMRSRNGMGSGTQMTLSRTVVRDVLEQGVSTFTHDALHDERYGAGESIVRQQIRSVMCAPMRTTAEILGVLYVDSHAAHQFNEAELELLAAIGNHAGIALHRERLLGEVEKLFLDALRAITAIIDAKDGYTHRHSERVSAFGGKLARELGRSAQECRVVELSGLLHDVGKIGVPDAILNKPGRLTPEEFTEMQRHPLHGAAILENIQSDRIRQLLPGVKYHHERWDGTGYPEGLAGEAIPLLGRILAVADVLDALASNRSYRQALSLSDAMAMIAAEAGRGFDPQVVAAAVALHDRGEMALPFAAGPSLQ